MNGLHVKHCLACEGILKPLTKNVKQALLNDLDNRWSSNDSNLGKSNLDAC